MLFEKIKLESDEKIIKIVRKHWFIVFSQGISIAIGALAPLVGWVIISTTSEQSTLTIPIEVAAYSTYFIFFYTFWLLLSWMTFVHMWTLHHLDVWVVTTRRIIVIDQVSLFRRKIGSFRLEKLQDVNIEIDGIIATFLSYGTVEAETASGGHDKEFRTKYLPHPSELKSVILEAADVLMKRNTTSPDSLS
jgi:hypothetical protein